MGLYTLHHSHPLSLTLPHSLTLTHTHIPSHSHSLTPPLMHLHVPYITHPPSLTLPHSHSLLTCIYPPSLTCTSLSVDHPLPHSHTLLHSLSLTLAYTLPRFLLTCNTIHPSLAHLSQSITLSLTHKPFPSLAHSFLTLSVAVPDRN